MLNIGASAVYVTHGIDGSRCVWRAFHSEGVVDDVVGGSGVGWSDVEGVIPGTGVPTGKGDRGIDKLKVRCWPRGKGGRREGEGSCTTYRSCLPGYLHGERSTELWRRG
jgi:hypothetical protein